MFDDQLNGGESQAALGVVTVTYAHQLSTILTQELLGALLPGAKVRLARITCSREKRGVTNI